MGRLAVKQQPMKQIKKNNQTDCKEQTRKNTRMRLGRKRKRPDAKKYKKL